MASTGETPTGVWLSAAFFLASGTLHVAVSISEIPQPASFLELWEVLGRGLLYLVIAAGLWKRFALCRSIAMLYCLAALLTDGIALGLALGHAPLRFPPSLVIQSSFEIPSCVLLLPFLRSARAASLFPRPLFGKRL